MSQHPGRLAGRVALVTGASRGLGASVARLFSEAGAAVVVTDVLDDEGRQFAESLGDAGGRAIYRPLDVRSERAWGDAVAAAEEAFGKLDVLVNNAGGGFATPGVAELTLEDWNAIVELNQTSAFLGIKHAVPALRRAGGGAIVNVSSVCGNVAIPGIPPPYTTSKGAVRLLTKSAAVELAAEGIRVNSVHPGRMQTLATAADTAEFVAFVHDQTPLGRSAHPDEIAYGVLFLASDEASYVTGSELAIDGGLTAR